MPCGNSALSSRTGRTKSVPFREGNADRFGLGPANTFAEPEKAALYAGRLQALMAKRAIAIGKCKSEAGWTREKI